MDKPFSAACERNRDPILDVLQRHLADVHDVLEIGSGTGQHAVHFATAMPWLAWQCTDRAEYLPGIRLWLDEAALTNTPLPLDLDVTATWPNIKTDVVFTANSLHIMGWQEVEAFFSGVSRVLTQDGLLIIYGPFNYSGTYTSDSNRDFDAWLKARDPRSGIRHAEDVDALARGIGLHLVEDNALPANNRCRVWQRTPFAPT